MFQPALPGRRVYFNRFRYMSDVLLDINDIKPLEIPAEVAPDAPQADNNQPEASTSTAAARPIVKAEKTATQTGKRSSSSRVIEIDDDEDEEVGSERTDLNVAIAFITDFFLLILV